jgi:hypothetical protein
MKGDPMSYTNRSGSWWPTPEEEHAAAAARRASDPNEHLSEILKPVKHRGVQSVALLGLEDEREKMADLVNADGQDDGIENLQKLGRAIQAAVDASRMSHPMIMGKDKDDHEISQAETKRRINWCIDIAREVRADLRWSLGRICEMLPRLLSDFLDGTFYEHFNEQRKFFAKKKLSRGLERQQRRMVGK